MKWNLLFTCTIFFTFANAEAYAFDGQRKGFILGGGLGGGFLSNKFTLASSSARASQEAILMELKIGFAPSNTLEIYYVNKEYFWRDTFFEGSFFEAKGTAVLMLNAVGVTKHLNTSGPGFFISAGLGPATFDSFRLDVDPAIGIGAFGGVGYEFSRHWSVQTDLMYLSIKGADISDPDFDLDSFGIRVSINFLVY